MSNPFTEHHIATTLYDRYGRPYCEAPLTPKSDSKRYLCVVPPEKVIPVVFVPGVMGSNLKVLEKLEEMPDFGPNAWFPDSAGFMALTFRGLSPHQRRLVLDPKNTAVADISSIQTCGMAPFKLASDATQQNWMQEFKRRGWGTVMLDCYGAVLCQLECHLNQIYYHGEINPYWHNRIKERVTIDYTGTRQESDWGDMTGFTALTDAELKHASNYWYPVHVVGYNWLQSNRQSGKYLAGKIDDIIDHYRKTLGYRCDKVILVTHSMGGLVARAACHPEMGNKADKVLGIVHNVMPANGAGTAYKRLHTGLEGAVSIVVGKNGPEVAAIFSNSPGALELLPNKRYGMGWLKVVDAHNRELLSLPKADPYAEIYRERNRWWRLMNPAWLDPMKNMSQSKNQFDQVWDKYLKNLGKAENFHDTLGDYYHPQSHVHYGADPAQATWGNVVWKENGDWTGSEKTAIINDGILSRTDALGHVLIKPADASQQTSQAWDRNGNIYTEARSWRGALQAAKEPGDGTVPATLSAVPHAKVRFSAAMKGFDHQGSYMNTAVQELTLYCIARIAQEAK